MFTDAILRDYTEHAELVAWCDTCQARTDYWNTYINNEFGCKALSTYRVSEESLTAFDAMIDATRPDTVIVTSVCATHDRYIIRAMEQGCDVVTEKPMTTTADKCAAIFQAIERTGRDLRVAFNYRWQPTFTALKEIVASGQIGTPTLVDFQWRLDTQHGADYFRRWHREKQHSGGLLVHKSTHHFDLVNWILEDRPATVFASGGLLFYGEKTQNVVASRLTTSGTPARPRPTTIRLPYTSTPMLKRICHGVASYVTCISDRKMSRDTSVTGMFLAARNAGRLQVKTPWSSQLDSEMERC